MSQTPLTGIIYDVRVDLTKLKQDLAQQEKLVAESAARANRATQAAGGDSVRSRVSDIDAQIQAMRRQVDSRLSPQARFRPTPFGDEFAVESRNRFRATAGGDAAAEGEGVGAFGQVAKIGSSLRTVGRAATGVLAAVEAINVAMKVGELIGATIEGSYNRQKKAADAVRDSINEIPIIGHHIIQLGEMINKLTIDKFTHESEYVEKLKKATEEQEKQIKHMEARAKMQEDFNQKFGSFTKGLVGEARGVGGTEDERTQAAIDEKKKELAKIVNEPGAKDEHGKLTETAKANFINASRAIQELEIARNEKIWQRQLEAQQSLDALKETHFDSEANRELAEDRKFAAERAKAEFDAKKRSKADYDIEVERTAELQYKRDAERAGKLAEERAKTQKQVQDVLAEQEEKKRKEADEAKITAADIRAETEGINLKAHGREAEAKIRDIERNFQKVVAGKGFDTFGKPVEKQEVIDAARERAEAEIKAVHEQRQRPEVQSASSFLMSGINTNTSEPTKQLVEIQKKALKALEDLAKGPYATAA
jgi:hypothetical protein